MEPIDMPNTGIIIARSVIRNNNGCTCPIRVMNVTMAEVVLPAQMIIGHEHPVIIDEQVVNIIDHTDVNALIEEECGLNSFPEATFQHLQPTAKKEVKSLLQQFKDIFKTKGSSIGCTAKVKHRIITQDVHPIAKAPYRVAHSQKEILNKEIEGLLQEGIIEESDSSWSAPVFLVKRKMEDGSTKVRLYIDFRSLNEITRKDFLPLPNIQDTLEQLHGAALFSTLDLASGYHQVEIAEEDKEKIAFSTPWGLYQWNRMAFGLCNAPSTFQRLMYCIWSGLTGEKCYVYLDDIIIYSKNDIHEHVNRLREIFLRLRQNDLRLNVEKCTFMATETSYLDHVICEEGIKPEPAKINAIREHPRPQNVKSFLGLVGFYRRFIKDFSTISKPLTALTKKEADFVWDESTSKSFDNLRNALISEPVLKYPDFSKPFIIATDASATGLGAVLSQIIDGEEHPISSCSCTMIPAELNYSTTEECLAVVWVIKTLRCYLYGRRFTIITDHRPLRWLLNLKDPSNRLARWALVLGEYEFDIIHRPGKQHGNADALSRAAVAQIDWLEPVWDRERVKQEQLADEYVQKIKNTLKEKTANTSMIRTVYYIREEVMIEKTVW